MDKYCDRKELMENQRGGEEVGRRKRSNNKGVGKGERETKDVATAHEMEEEEEVDHSRIKSTGARWGN